MQGQVKAVGDETGKWVGTVVLWMRKDNAGHGKYAER